uniref:RAB11 family interacting protein 5 n=1 Tax=Cairina moschata TaxID=8855 RepID=A0A8C3BTV9_CAIMO
MALLRAAPLPTEPAPCWLPTHVQVTAVRARGLRCKGGGSSSSSTGESSTTTSSSSSPAAGPGDVYAVLELGRQRHRTAVAERSGGSAEWQEEGCALELPPEPGSPPVLTITVLQKALLGADRFLGRCSLALPCPAPPGRVAELGWHKLHSKAGKKEKERGEVEVSVRFTRSSLTASMFDLSAKDKPRSPFGKLKDKMKGKKKYDLESASAIIPSSVGALDVEDDFDVGAKKSKIKGFLKSKLRKSSLTQSNTSLGSDSTISSASLGPAANEGIKSPSRHSSLSTERSVRDFLPSPRLTHKRAFSDDVSQVSPVLEPKTIQNLKPKSDPVSRSSLCINGSHVYGDEPALHSPTPAPRSSAPLPVPGGPRSLVLQEELKVSTKAVTLSNHLGRARMEESGRSESKPTQAAAPMVSSAETRQEKQLEESRKDEKKPKGGFFHHGGTKGDAGGRGQGEKTGGSPAAGDERSRAGGWFASKEPKESPQKPSSPPGPPASTEVAAGSLGSSADCSPPASLRLPDPLRDPPAQNLGVPVPETAPPPHGDLPPPAEQAAAAPLPPPPLPLSEWDATFDAFASSRLNPEAKEENLSAPALAEGIAFIDDPEGMSPAGGSAEKGAKALEKPQVGGEVAPALMPWTNFSGLDVGANLVSTTQEATVIEDVLSPVSAGSGGRRRKSSTPMVWTPAFSPGKPGGKETSAARSAEKRDGEGEENNEEESSSLGENGWMTIATETASEPSESTRSIGQESAFGQRPFLGEGASEAKSAPGAAACVLPRSKFPPETSSQTLPGGNVATVPPRVLPEGALRRFPEPGRDPQGPPGGREETFDIRTSVYRLQASMRLEAGEGRLRLSSDVRERRLVLSPWPAVRGEQEEIVVPGSDASPPAPPPKPPRWFAAAGGRGDEEEEEEEGCEMKVRQQGGEGGAEGLQGDVELPRRHPSGETSVPAPPSPAAPGAAADAEGAPEIPAPGDASLGTEPSEMSGEDAAEQFETCPSKLSLGSWSQPASSPQSPGPGNDAELETAPEQQQFPEELSVSGLTPSSRLDSGQPEAFWTAVEEQETAGWPQRLAPGHSPPQPKLELVVGHGAGQAQGRPSELQRSSDSRMDFKKADFWKADGAEERNERDASVPGNPFVPAASPIAPSNPFVDKPPEPLPVRAVPPEKLGQGFGFSQLPEETLQPTNLPGEPPSLHASQPLAFSTPFLVAATNPEPFHFPSPAASSRAAAAQPCPWLQSGDTPASALVVLPRETQPAEKPFCQQTTSPHPVKPISAVVQEEKKQQQHKSSLTQALSNGLEKLKTVTTGSIQPLAPSSHPEKADPKKLKDPGVLDQSARYYHLTHDELIQLLLQREKELSKKEEHIQELENYIDQLLVRIMEQSPTLLQIPLGGETKTK